LRIGIKLNSKLLLIIILLQYYTYIYISQLRNEIEKLRMSRYIFGCLCRAIVHMNNIFSIPTLITISSKLITIVYYLFSIIYQIKKPNPLMEITYLGNIAGFSLDIFVIFIYFTAADMPIKQASIFLMYCIIFSKKQHESTVTLCIFSKGPTSSRKSDRQFQQYSNTARLPIWVWNWGDIC